MSETAPPQCNDEDGVTDLDATTPPADPPSTDDPLAPPSPNSSPSSVQPYSYTTSSIQIVAKLLPDTGDECGRAVGLGCDQRWRCTDHPDGASGRADLARPRAISPRATYPAGGRSARTLAREDRPRRSRSVSTANARSPQRGEKIKNQRERRPIHHNPAPASVACREVRDRWRDPTDPVRPVMLIAAIIEEVLVCQPLSPCAWPIATRA